MWVITTRGFYSAVQHRDNPDLLVVRTRSKADAETLSKFYQGFLDATPHTAWNTMPPAEVLSYAVSDYPWRVIMPRRAWQAFLEDVTDDLDYGNFKDAVKAAQGPDRAQVYSTVWGDLLEIEYQDPQGRPRPAWDVEPWDEYDAWEATRDDAMDISLGGGLRGLWDDVRDNPTPAQVTEFLSVEDMRAEDYGKDDDRP